MVQLLSSAFHCLHCQLPSTFCDKRNPSVFTEVLRYEPTQRRQSSRNSTHLIHGFLLWLRISEVASASSRSRRGRKKPTHTLKGVRLPNKKQLRHAGRFRSGSGHVPLIQSFVIGVKHVTWVLMHPRLLIFPSGWIFRTLDAPSSICIISSVGVSFYMLGVSQFCSNESEHIRSGSSWYDMHMYVLVI